MGRHLERAVEGILSSLVDNQAMVIELDRVLKSIKVDNPFTVIRVDSLSKVIELDSLLKSIKVDNPFTVIRVDSLSEVIKVDSLVIMVDSLVVKVDNLTVIKVDSLVIMVDSLVIRVGNPFMVFKEDIRIQAIVVELLRCNWVDRIEVRDNRMLKEHLELAFRRN